MSENSAAIRNYPNSFETEQYLLGAILIDGDVAADVVPSVSDEFFYNPRHAKIFRAAKQLQATGRNIDVVTVNDVLEKNKDTDINMLEYLTELAQTVISTANYREYVAILNRDNILRRIIKASNETIKEAYESGDAEQVLEKAEKRIYEISQNSHRGALEPLSHVSGALLKKYNAVCKDRSLMRGLMTHYPIFDGYTNGLQRSDLIILAARPSVGKTSFALNIVANIVNAGETDKVIAIFSLEMSGEQLAQRMFSNLTSVSLNILGKGVPNLNQQEELWNANAAIANSEVYVDDAGMQSAGEILSKCRSLSNTLKKPIDLVIIDYLGLMKSESGRRNDSKANEIGEISRMLKLSAKELNCPIVLICQMSRGIEGRDDKTPKLSDLRDSGSIEQDADIVLFLSRENENDKGKQNYNVILDISKHRNGELGAIRYKWDGPHIRFEEADDQYINREFQPKSSGRQE